MPALEKLINMTKRHLLSLVLTISTLSFFSCGNHTAEEIIDYIAAHDKWRQKHMK